LEPNFLKNLILKIDPENLAKRPYSEPLFIVSIPEVQSVKLFKVEKAGRSHMVPLA
jgi:hypothetical protein